MKIKAKHILFVTLFLFACSALIAGKSFVTKLISSSFVPNSPSGGTVSLNVRSTGNRGMSQISNLSGSYSVSPQGKDVYHVFASASGESNKYKVIWRGNFLSNASDGNITSTSMTVTKINKKRNQVKISQTCSGTGSWDTVEPNTTTGAASGSF